MAAADFFHKKPGWAGKPGRELLHTVQRQRNNYYKLEMLALKSKLNPHFLYNAFDMIYWKMVLKNEYEIDISDELSECEMPKLLIQPLVENAIKYGMNEQEGQLHVSLRQEGGYLVFEVRDNGKGMPPETCRRLLEDDTGDQGGFGVRLVKAMVKSTYGEECGVSTYSREGWGTKVTVRILRDVPVPEYIR